MAMLAAKTTRTTILLIILVVATIALPDAAVPPEWKAALKALDAMDVKMRLAVDGVVAAAPPAKRAQVMEATTKERFDVSLALAAGADDDDDDEGGGSENKEKKVERMAASYEKAADLVIATPPEDKFKVMKEAFRAVTKAAA